MSIHKTRGLRPLQKVIYLTETIKETLLWKGYLLKDILSFDKVLSTLGEEDILTFFSLNGENARKEGEFTLLSYPYPVGENEILRIYSQEITDNGLEGGEVEEELNRYRDLINLGEHNRAALKELVLQLEKPSEVTDGYEILDDEFFLFIVLKPNDRDLLDQKVKSKVTKRLARDVVKTFHKYVDREQVASTLWFKHYLSRL